MQARLQGTKTLPARDQLAAALRSGEQFEAADAAMLLGADADDQFPDALRPSFTAIQLAFTEYQAGRDNAARAALQVIGLTCPFLEWKLLLRGLIAYSAHDDARALENWSRLTAARLPARLIAPLRFAIDAEFRAAQPAKSHEALQRRGDRLSGSLVTKLRSLASLIARGRTGEALRETEPVLAEFKKELPDAVERFRRGIRQAVVANGGPRDFDRLRKLQIAPSDDPDLSRLQALAAEHGHAYARANKHWIEFGRSIANNPAWSPNDRARAQAHVWCRIARNADSADADGLPMHPTAESAYQQATKLAPDMLEPLERLFAIHRERGRLGQAAAIGKRIIRQFPDHAATLDALAEICHSRLEFKEALEFAERALAANPLNQQSRNRLAELRVTRARAQANSGEFAAARSELEQAFKHCDRGANLCTIAFASALAFKDGAAHEAEEHAWNALSINGMAGAFALTAEASRYKLPKALRLKYEKQFSEALGQDGAEHSAVCLATALESVRSSGAYIGSKGHEKKIRTRVESAIAAGIHESELVKLCWALDDLSWHRLLKKAAAQGQQRFPSNPFFPFFEAMARLGESRKHRPPAWKMEPLLEKSRRLVQALPMCDELRELLGELDELRESILEQQPFACMMNDFFQTLVDSHR